MSTTILAMASNVMASLVRCLVTPCLLCFPAPFPSGASDATNLVTYLGKVYPGHWNWPLWITSRTAKHTKPYTEIVLLGIRRYEKGSDGSAATETPCRCWPPFRIDNVLKDIKFTKKGSNDPLEFKGRLMHRSSAEPPPMDSSFRRFCELMFLPTTKDTRPDDAVAGHDRPRIHLCGKPVTYFDERTPTADPADIDAPATPMFPECISDGAGKKIPVRVLHHKATEELGMYGFMRYCTGVLIDAYMHETLEQDDLNAGILTIVDVPKTQDSDLFRPNDNKIGFQHFGEEALRGLNRVFERAVKTRGYKREKSNPMRNYFQGALKKLKAKIKGWQDEPDQDNLYNLESEVLFPGLFSRPDPEEAGLSDDDADRARAYAKFVRSQTEKGNFEAITLKDIEDRIDAGQYPDSDALSAAINTALSNLAAWLLSEENWLPDRCPDDTSAFGYEKRYFVTGPKAVIGNGSGGRGHAVEHLNSILENKLPESATCPCGKVHQRARFPDGIPEEFCKRIARENTKELRERGLLQSDEKLKCNAGLNKGTFIVLPLAAHVKIWREIKKWRRIADLECKRAAKAFSDSLKNETEVQDWANCCKCKLWRKIDAEMNLKVASAGGRFYCKDLPRLKSSHPKNPCAAPPEFEGFEREIVQPSEPDPNPPVKPPFLKPRARERLASIPHSEYTIREGEGAAKPIVRAHWSQAPGAPPIVLKRLAHSRDAKQQDRFMAEAAALKSLRHPNVVTFLFYCKQDGPNHATIGMEDLGDKTLRKTIDEKSDEHTFAGDEKHLRLCTDIASGLAFLHSQGVVHNDVKPDNIMVHEGCAKLIDFGVWPSRHSHTLFSQVYYSAVNLHVRST